MRILLIALAAALLAAGPAVAANPCGPAGCCEPAEVCGTPDSCGKCGVQACCKKVCKVVCEMKEVKKTVWAVECEEFCAPLPTCPCSKSAGCGKGCGPAGCGEEGCEPAACGSCNGCGKGDPCAELAGREVIPPKCGPVRTRKKLVKKEIKCKVPTYKCVVVHCCSGCADVEEKIPAATPAEAPSDEAPLPPPPQTTSRPSLTPIAYRAEVLRSLQFDP